MIRRYTLPTMGAIWTEQARFEAMLRVELAVARAQARRGQVPAAALDKLETRSQVVVERIAEIEQTTDHDVIAFVSQVAESVGPEGRYLHLGLTSSDVVDTGLALQLRAAGARLLSDADRLIAALVARARAEADTVLMGRTHSVHAEPTTMGLKLAGWAFEIDRGRRRLARAVRLGALAPQVLEAVGDLARPEHEQHQQCGRDPPGLHGHRVSLRPEGCQG